MAEAILFCQKINHQAELFNFKNQINKETNDIFIKHSILQVKHLSSIWNAPQTVNLLPNLKKHIFLMLC